MDEQKQYVETAAQAPEEYKEPEHYARGAVNAINNERLVVLSSGNVMEHIIASFIRQAVSENEMELRHHLENINARFEKMIKERDEYRKLCVETNESLRNARHEYDSYGAKSDKDPKDPKVVLDAVERTIFILDTHGLHP